MFKLIESLRAAQTKITNEKHAGSKSAQCAAETGSPTYVHAHIQ